jgi:hypothetical protein
MNKGQSARVSVAVRDDSVVVAPSAAGGFRISSGGQLVLAEQARNTLEKGTARHFWLELDDSSHLVVLHPYK